MTIDLTSILEALLGVIAIIITAYVIPWINEKKLSKWVIVAVNAAEQLYAGSGRGEEKKAYVIDFLKTKGYTIDINNITDTVNTLIESMVYELKISKAA